MRSQLISVNRKTVEDIINEEMTTFLRGAGFIDDDQRIRFTLPGGNTFMLPVEVAKEFHEERLVCTLL